MRINIFKTTEEMGTDAAKLVARKLREAIVRQGSARLLLSTGASQFETIDALTREDVAWDKVTMFHLDEYVALPESHPASFRKYLKERFISKIALGEAVFVSGEGDVEANIAALTSRIKEAPIDVGVIGIGENAHIAFNDPPAKFDATESYMVVDLDEKCKNQQVGEGWFATLDDVPKQAITMSVQQIMDAKVIISVVPHAVKAQAVYQALTQEVNNMIPATILKTHADWNLYLDEASSAKIVKMP